MSLAQLWATLRAARWTMLLMVLIATGVAWWLVAQEPKQYTAKARVMLNIDNTDPNQFSALARNTEAQYIGTETRLVADEAVTKDVVTKLGWPDNPQVIAAWQGATGGIGDVTTWAAHQIGNAIFAQPLEDSSIIEIYYSSTSLDAAKQIVAMVRSAYMDQSLKLRAEAARRAAAWNRTQAARALATLQAAEAARAAFVRDNAIAVDTPAGGLDYVAQATAMMATVVKDPAARSAVEVPAVAALQRRIDALDAEIAVVQQRGDENPVTVGLIAQRDLARQQLAREQAGASAATTPRQIGLVRQQRDANYLAARLRLLERAPLYDRLAAMDRDVVLKTDRYKAAAARVASFDAVAAAPSGLKVIGDVIADNDPTFPNVPATLAIAAGASLALSAAFAVVGELIRRRVRGVEDLDFFARAPVLAVIPAGQTARRRLRVGQWLSRPPAVAAI